MCELFNNEPIRYEEQYLTTHNKVDYTNTNE